MTLISKLIFPKLIKKIISIAKFSEQEPVPRKLSDINGVDTFFFLGGGVCNIHVVLGEEQFSNILVKP